MNKLWQTTGKKTDLLIEKFTVGKDKEFDLSLAEWDVLGSIAHAKMLYEIKILSEEEKDQLVYCLRSIYEEIKAGDFSIEEGVEDVHSQIEFLLTNCVGNTGKKIHSGRSRNDQVLLDIKLVMRHELSETVSMTRKLFHQLQILSEQHKNKLLPGYTHLQLAMPSSFGLWFGAYAESLVDDMELLLAAFKIANKNPLGSGAGYGSSFPLRRELTTRLLGFDTLNYNVVYAQMTRGKSEKITAMALANLASTLSRFSMDVCLYLNQNFNFISFPEKLTTGSSIMPHKKNPDVFELIRGKCNRLQSLPTELSLLCTNLPSGYHREMQLTKEILFPAFSTLQECISICTYMLQHIEVNDTILNDECYSHMFSVEEVNREVLRGVPFREAYKNTAKQIAENSFDPDKTIRHTHEGSIGNLCNEEIAAEFNALYGSFNFKKINNAIRTLLSED